MSWAAKLRKRWRGIDARRNGNDVQSERFRMVITHECLEAITAGIAPACTARKEGVLYLLGVTDATNTLIAGTILPKADTTSGSFDVSSQSMAAVVRTACDTNLHVVGQLHTHLESAYHSRGDEVGARIRFPGFTSIVVPRYGDGLPDLNGSAVFMVDSNGEFQPLDLDDVTILPREVLWRT